MPNKNGHLCFLKTICLFCQLRRRTSAVVLSGEWMIQFHGFAKRLITLFAQYGNSLGGFKKKKKKFHLARGFSFPGWHFLCSFIVSILNCLLPYLLLIFLHLVSKGYSGTMRKDSTVSLPASKLVTLEV